MVNTVSIAFMIFSALFTTLGPVIAAILFYRKQKFYVGSLFIGAAVFFLFQMILRIPLIQMILPNMEWYKTMSQNIWVYAIFLGFTAGLFEEAGRYLAFTVVLKKHLLWKDAVAFGIGHGGIECILLVGMSQISNLVTSIMINSGMYEPLVAQSPEQSRELLLQAKATLVDTPSYMFLISSVERLFTFFIHIAFSVLVMTGIKKKKGLLYLGLAILLHMLVDSPAVILSYLGVNVLFIEVLIMVFAVVSFIYICRQKNSEVLSK